MSEADIVVLVQLLDRALPHLRVRATGGDTTLWCADVLAHVHAGDPDPLAPWRRALEEQQGSHGVPHVAAAFVLQWWCEAVAVPMAYAAELASVVLVTEGGRPRLGLELAPGLYPETIVLDPDRVGVETHPNGRGAALEAGSAAYRRVVEDVVRDFAPDVKMGSRQRWGVVSDVWRTAAHRAAGAAGRVTGPDPRRVSCCFIYALPGMNECSVCPRRRVD